MWLQQRSKWTRKQFRKNYRKQVPHCQLDNGSKGLGWNKRDVNHVVEVDNCFDTTVCSMYQRQVLLTSSCAQHAFQGKFQVMQSPVLDGQPYLPHPSYQFLIPERFLVKEVSKLLTELRSLLDEWIERQMHLTAGFDKKSVSMRHTTSKEKPRT